jgi:hypothetical protein
MKRRVGWSSCVALLVVLVAACSSGAPKGFGPPPAPQGDRDAGGGAGDEGGPTSNGGNDGGDGGQSVSGSGGTTPSACKYPPGPYGIHTNETVSGSLSWQGFVDGGTTATTVAMSDYFDCDGKKGINAVLLDTSAVWCANCQTQSSQLQSTMQTTWAGLGVKVLVLMWQDASTGPATLGDAAAWTQTYGLGAGFSVVVDVAFTFADPNSSVGLPRNMLLDPRTMRIITEADGQGGNVDQVVAEFARNNRTH